MDNDQIKQFIAKKVEEGLSLSKIQDELKANGVKMTFMEVRLLASEISSAVFKKQEAAKEKSSKNQQNAPAIEDAPSASGENAPSFEEELPPPQEEELPPEDVPADKQGSVLRGQTKVSLSKIQRPGYLATGSVTFGSGAEGDWLLDQSGRLGFERLEGKPDKQDIEDFQLELRKLFGA